MAHGPERMIPNEVQEHSTVQQTPDSVTLPSPATLIVRSLYRRDPLGLESLLSRENAGKIIIGPLEKAADHRNRTFVFGGIIRSISRNFTVHSFPSASLLAKAPLLARKNESNPNTKE